MSIDSRPSTSRSKAEEAAPRAGEVLAGRYYVERVLGAGGMGCVVAATHVHLDERVAVKLLHPHLVSEPDTVQRFLREGRTAGRIQSSHVVRIKDVGELDGGQPYIVMEYLEGEDLAATLKKRGVLPPQQAVDYVLAAADAIAEAHAMKMLHRDLKPSNIFLARLPDGREHIKVLDFGIAKAFGAESTAGHLTATSMVMGTPAFMAPEQLRKARALDHRVDIWALGVLLHKLVTNTLPFDGDTFAELSAAILTAEPRPIRSVLPQLSPELDAVIATCLRKNPDDRFVDLADLALALAPLGTPASRPNVDRVLQILGRPSQRAVPVVPASDPSIAATTGAAMNVSGAQASSSSKGLTITLAIVAALLALVGIAIGGIALKARAARAAATEGPSPSVALSAALVGSSAPSASTEARATSTPATSAEPSAFSAPAPSVTSAPKSSVKAGVTRPAGPKAPPPTAPATQVAPAVPPAPPSPAGIATSSKD
ncbi:MAG: protein kinase [Deltaproteobacteria bacterium]|nr:protein kinase [Deltaproteobacteria bacterium]